eukprot:TRINITY_DN10375_c0_g1_i1.p1 TRINITY_DN10375_c0_g1~~TRINITY_DN10375_c0_g1_i1.p1  ORF type:complete len:342 (+),score=24.27 TRINITY_DN10375_c0_g1_i1:1352-2377(+)
MLARLYLAQRQYELANTAFQSALSKNSFNGVYWCSYGVMLSEQFKYPQAFEAFSRALKLSPRLQEGYINIAAVYEVFNQFADAINVYDKVLQINPNCLMATIRSTILRRSIERRIISFNALPQEVPLRFFHPTVRVLINSNDIIQLVSDTNVSMLSDPILNNQQSFIPLQASNQQRPSSSLPPISLNVNPNQRFSTAPNNQRNTGPTAAFLKEEGNFPMPHPDSMRDLLYLTQGRGNTDGINQPGQSVGLTQRPAEIRRQIPEETSLKSSGTMEQDRGFQVASSKKGFTRPNSAIPAPEITTNDRTDKSDKRARNVMLPVFVLRAPKNEATPPSEEKPFEN